MLLAQMVVSYMADTSKLVSGVQAAAKSQKIMQNATSSATSSMSSGFQKATSSVQALASKGNAAKISAQALAQAQAQAGVASAQLAVAQAKAASSMQKFNEMASSGKASAEKLAVAQAQASLAAERVKTAQLQAANAIKKAADASAAMAKETTKATTFMGKLSVSADGVRKNFLAMSKGAATLAGVGLAGVGAALVGVGAALIPPTRAAADFEEAMLRIQATNDVTSQQIKQLGDTLLDLGPKVGKGPLDLADGLYYVMGAGYGASEAMDILTRSAKAVAGSATATTVPANALTAVLKAFPGLSVAKAMDTLTVAVATGKTEWQDFGPAIGQVSLFAQMAGASFDEASASLSTLTNVMPSTSEAATALKSLFEASSSASRIAEQAEKLGIAFDANAYSAMSFIDRLKYLDQITDGNSESLKKMLGTQEAMVAIQGLLSNGAQDYSKALDNITNSSGAADKAFKTASEGAKFGWAQAEKALESLQVKLGTALLPAVKLFSEEIAPAIENVIKWAEENKALEKTISAIEGVFKGVKETIGTFIESEGFKSFVSNVSYLGDQLKNTAQPALDGIKASAGTAFEGLGPTLEGIAKNAGDFAKSLGDMVKWFNDGSAPAEVLKAALIGIGVAIVAIQIGSLVATIPALVAGFIAWGVAAWGAAAGVIAATWPLLAIGAAIAVVVAIIVLAVQHWGEIVSFLQGVWGGFSSWFMGVLSAIGVFFINVWIGIQNGLQVAWAFIINILTVGGQMLLNAILAPFMAIGAAFVWLYNHNYYFQALVDFIVAVVSVCVAWLQNAWQVSIDWLVGAWGALVGFATGLWAAISGAIHTGFSVAIGFVASVWGSISAFFVNAWGSYIVGPLTSLWNNVSNVFASAWSTYVSGPVASLWGSLSSTISGWASNALSWGANLIQAFIDGIASKAGQIGGALADTAAKIASFLGFHSPTKEGPGRYADQWAPNFMRMYEEGLLSGIPRLESVIGKITTPIALGFSRGPDMGASTLPRRERESNSAQDKRDRSIILVLDGRQVARGLVPHIGPELAGELRAVLR